MSRTRRTVIAGVVLSLAAASSAGAQTLHDPDTEALAAATLEKYRAADLAGAFVAARANLEELHRFSMKSIQDGADYQALTAMRQVVNSGAAERPYSPEILIFEPAAAVFSNHSCPDRDEEEDDDTRPLRGFVQCDLGFSSNDELTDSLTRMKDRLDELRGAESAARSGERRAPSSDAEKGPPRLGSVFDAFADNDAARPARRNVEIAPTPDAGVLSPRAAFQNLSALPAARPYTGAPAPATAPTASVPGQEIDCSATLIALDDDDNDESGPASRLERKFESAVICAFKKADAISEEKKALARDKSRYAMIDLCLTRVANGRYDEDRLNSLEKSLSPTTAVVGAISEERATAVEARTDVSRLANRCAADALADYFKHMSRASETETGSNVFVNLIAALFTKVGDEEVCEAILGNCKEIPSGNPFVDPQFLKKWTETLAAWGGTPDDGAFDQMNRAIKAIAAAKLKSMVDAEKPPIKPADVAAWIKDFAGKIDSRLSEIVTTASDLGVQLAAVEGQLDAVNFILGAAAAGAAPELDAGKACSAIDVAADKTACEERLAALSPRVKAAAAVAGSAPGLLDAMQKLIDETAQPPPLQLVIASRELTVRAETLRKRLALLDAERLTWAGLARHYHRLAESTNAILNTLDVACGLFKRPKPPTGEACMPADISALYKSNKPALTPDQRKVVLDAAANYAHLFWLNRYGRGEAFNKLIHLGHENQLLIDEEATGLAAAAIDATLVEIDFRAKRGLRAESVADFTARLINLGLLTAIAIGGE
ncbi:MAG: hypothetical protein ABL957_06195 [Parvularculaceae bacterium]